MKMKEIGAVFSSLADTGEPPLIAQLARASWLTGVAKSAIGLEIFTKLREGKQSSEWIASQLEANPIHTREILNSCVSIGLLERVGDEYQNTDVSASYLVKGEPNYFGEAFTYLAGLGGLFDKVDTAMLSGEEMSHEEEFQSEDDEAAYWRHYMLAMNQWGGGAQQQLLLENADLTGKKKMLDVGAGSGVYTVAFCRRYPDLSGVLFDQEKALPVARSIIETEGLSKQISTLAGDYYVDPFGEDYDAVLFSGVLIQEPLDGQLRLLKKAYESMNSGGLIIVQDVLKIGDYTETIPKIALESLVASVFYGGAGGVVSGQDTAEMLTSAGFTLPRQIPLPGVYSMVTAVKP
jgi:cyclopropane fatty-acyl-phospholipid synthase-like methyltransferase